MSKVQIKDVFDLQMGKTPSRKNFAYWTDGSIDWVSIRDLGTYDRYVGGTREHITQLAVDESGIRQVPPNTLIMSFKLSLGKTAITVKPTYTNEAIMAFIDKGCYPFDIGYLFHQFSAKDWTAGTNMAVMGATLNKKTLSESWIELPNEEEQHRIACLFDTVCERMADAHRLLDGFDELVKSRFVEMFGDTSGEYCRLEDCCTRVVGGKTPSMKHPEYYGGDIPFIKSGDVKEDVVSSGVLWLSEEAIEKASVKLVPSGSVLVVVRSALLKRKVCTSICSCDVAINQDIRAFSPKPEFTPSYLLWSIRSHEQELLNRVRSVNTSGIDMKQLYDLSIYVAPIEKQQEFEAFVQQVDKLKFESQRAIDKLQLLYDSLAQEYFGR